MPPSSPLPVAPAAPTTTAPVERDLVTGYDAAARPAVVHHTTGQVLLTPGADVAYVLGAERWCIGYRTPAGDTGPCPDAARAAVGAACASCATATMLQPCITRCTGARCVNAARRRSCVPVAHYVYLAYYADDVIKVGVTKRERFAARITEQGALAAVAIHAAGGQDVRALETRVRTAGYVDRTDVVPLLCTPHPAPAHMEDVLRETAARVAVRMPDVPWMSRGPMVTCTPHYPAPLLVPPRVLDAAHDPLCGTVLGVRGGHVLLQLPASVPGAARGVGVLSLRSLLGRTIAPASGESLCGPGQLALWG